MKFIIMRHWVTPAVIGAGLFVAASGVLMFTGIREPVEHAHEWIGLVFAAAIALHVATHWRGFRGYFAKPLALGIVAAIALAITLLMLPADEGEGGHGLKRLVHRIEAAPLTAVAPLLDRSADRVASDVRAAGFAVEGTDQSVAAIAAANGVEPKTVLRLLLD